MAESTRRPPVILRYGAAVLSVIVALLIAKWVQTQYAFETFVSFLCAMAFSAWFGGIKPGLLTLVLSVFAFHYYLLLPVYPPEKEMPRLFVVALTSLFILFFSIAQRRTTESLRQMRDDLNKSVKELKRANESLQVENVERKWAEEAVKQAEDRTRLIIDTIPNMVWSVQPNGTVDFLNQRWLDYTGLSMEQSTREPTLALHPDDTSKAMDKWTAAVASGQPYEEEMRLRRADGKYLWFLIRTAPLRDVQGNIVKWFGASIDIEDRKQSEQMLRDSREQLRALTARLESLREEERIHIAREIHDDLGQKLTGLKMDLLRAERKIEGLESSPAVNLLLDTIVSATELVGSITTSIQEIAANLRPGTLDKLGLNATLRYESRRFQERTGISCEINLPETELDLSTEISTALFRIFQECLTNIARHTRATKVTASLKPEDGWLTLRVQDNGQGITEAEIRNPASLGLLGMKERTALLGGEIIFHGNPGSGTTVTVRMEKNETPGQRKQIA